MLEPLAPDRRSDRLALAILFAGALVVRIVAAFLVEHLARAKGTLCLFDDTLIYWHLAGTIREGSTFVVSQFGIPHFALRTPGYPVFLAACQGIFGSSNTLAPRLVQALLGASCVPLVYLLTRRVWPEARSAALIACGLAAFEPYWAATSALLLSEAVFVPLMLVMLCGLSTAWTRGEGGSPSFPFVGLGAGVSAGLAILVKPSWALAPPAIILAWVLVSRSRRSLIGAAFFCVGIAIAMGPWWARNARVFDRFVPTALWAGASLYDGLNPSADGSSDMRFLARDEFKALGEVEQDETLRRASFAFARDNPGRVIALAVVKAGRFWSPWPNASEFRASRTNLASAAVTLPMFALLFVGMYEHRRDARALVLLAGPLLYFFALHLLFVSSIRYRIPAMVPALGLVASGFLKLASRRRSTGDEAPHRP